MRSGRAKVLTILVHLVLPAAGSRMAEGAGNNPIQKQLEALNKEFEGWTASWKAAKDKDEKDKCWKMLEDLNTRRKNLEDKLTGGWLDVHPPCIARSCMHGVMVGVPWSERVLERCHALPPPMAHFANLDFTAFMHHNTNLSLRICCHMSCHAPHSTT